MYFFIKPLIATLSIYVFGVFIKKKSKPIIYILFFLAYCLLDLILGQKAYAADVGRVSENQFIEIQGKNCIPNANIEKKHLKIALNYLLRIQSTLTPENRRFYEEKVQFHAKNGEECYNKAEGKSWYLPDLTDRKKADICFLTALGLLFPGEPKIKIAAAISVFMAEYGPACVDEWHEIQSLLYEADYHYEMMLFYQEVLDTDGGNT